jgi:uncharacterized surface anchored protein
MYFRYQSDREGNTLALQHQQGLVGLAPGTYVIEETRPAPGYQLSNPAVQTACITDSEQCVVELVFTNPKMGRLVITKLDSATKQPIAGVTLAVRLPPEPAWC